MPIYDPLASRFSNQPADPWQVSSKKFDFDSGFVKWIQKYLEARKVVFDVLAAKQWINGAKFDEKRYDDCTLQWEAYQESVANRPIPKAVVANPSQSGGVGDSACESVDDRADDALTSPSPSLEGGEQEKSEFDKREGESSAEYVARMSALSKAKMAKMQEKFSFRSK